MERYVDLSPVERVRLRPCDHNGPCVIASFQRLVTCVGPPYEADWTSVPTVTIPAEKVSDFADKLRAVAAEAVTRTGVPEKGDETSG